MITLTKIEKAGLEKLKKLHETGTLVGVFETTIEDYHNAPGISSTMLKWADNSPATYRHFVLNPEPPSEAMTFGNILHTLVLEPEKFHDRYFVAPEGMDRRGTNAWKELVSQHKGKTVIKFTEFTRAKEMADQARLHPRAALLDGLKELSFFWKDPKTGLLCKCRPDNLTSKGVIVDYKTAEQVYPARVWSRQLASYFYHVQAAFQLDGVVQAMQQIGHQFAEGMKPAKVVHYAQEKEGANLVKPWLVSESTIQLGRRSYLKILSTIKKCEEAQTWPGYPAKIEEVSAPDYLYEGELSDE